MPQKLISHTRQLVGKSLPWSKAMEAWVIRTGHGLVEIIVISSYLTMKRKVLVDGQEIYRGRSSLATPFKFMHREVEFKIHEPQYSQYTLKINGVITDSSLLTIEPEASPEILFDNLTFRGNNKESNAFFSLVDAKEFQKARQSRYKQVALINAGSGILQQDKRALDYATAKFIPPVNESRQVKRDDQEAEIDD